MPVAVSFCDKQHQAERFEKTEKKEKARDQRACGRDKEIVKQIKIASRHSQDKRKKRLKRAIRPDEISTAKLLITFRMISS